MDRARPSGISMLGPGPRVPGTEARGSLISSLYNECPAFTLQVPVYLAALCSLHRVSGIALILRAKVGIDVPVATKPVNVTLGLRHRW